MLLDVVMAEVAKTATASVAGAGLSHLGSLWQLIRRKSDAVPGGLPADPVAAAQFLVECGRDDPQWAGMVAEELARRVAPEVAAVIPPPVPFCDRDAVRAGVPETGMWVFGGPRGSGKTALVCQLAADLASRCPVDRCFVDLDMFRDGDVPRLAEAKRHVLGQLGVCEVAVAEPELSQQYLRAGLHRRMVLVLDNVVDAQEVAALAPGWSASLVLVTTRRLTDDLRGRYPGCLELEGLDDAGAWAMLASRCGDAVLAAEPGATRDLLWRFGNLPYAIGQLGAVLARRAREPGAVAGLVAEFAAAGITDTNELIGRLVADTTALLSAPVFEDFLLLATHPGGEFTVSSADELLGRPARRSVDELRDVGLVVARDQGRYLIPWFARRYAEESARQRGLDTDPAFERVLSFYAHRAVAADRAVGERLRRYPVPQVPPGALDWPSSGPGPVDSLDAERDVLADLVEQACLRGRHEQAVQLCGGLEVLSLHRGRYELCQQAFERGVFSAQQLDNSALVARLHALSGRMYTLLHLFERAQAKLDAAWEVLRTLDDPDPELESSTWEFTGRLAEEQAGYQPVPDYRAAIDALTCAVDIDRRIGHGRALGLHTRMLANVLVKDGRAGEALRLLAEAAAATTDDRNGSRVCTVRAKAYVALNDLWAAQVDIDRAHQLADGSNAGQYRHEMADVGAEIAFRMGDVGTARSRWGWLAQEFLNAGHSRSAEYLAKLNWLPPVARG